MKRFLQSCILAIAVISSANGQLPEIIHNDLLVNNGSRHYAVVDSIYYFQAHDGDYDWELWRTNGTEAGSFRVANIHPDGPSYANELTRVGNVLFFLAYNQNAPEQLYKTDGSEVGTQWLANVDSLQMEQYHMLTASGGLLYFRTYRPDIFTELWVSDGSTENTHMLADICEDYPSNPQDLTDFNGSLVFIAHDCNTGGTTLYRTQGIDGSINQVGGYQVRALMHANNHLYFVSTHEDYGGELSMSSGAIANVTRISDIAPGETSSNIYHQTQVNNLLFFRAYDPDNGAELWTYDMNAETIQLVKDINPGANNSSFPSQLICFKEKLFFCANDGIHGDELWISDGTGDGTYMLKNIREEIGEVVYHSYPQKFFATDSILYFMADDGVHGPELWQSDGTSEGTRMTADIWPKSSEGSDPGGFAIAGDYLIFNAWYGKRTLFRLKLNTSSSLEIKDSGPAPTISIYPNPAESYLVVETHSPGTYSYRIMDISGREILQGSFQNRLRTQVDISSLSSGLYFLKAELGPKAQICKFIVQ